jgi:hypothetical protein
MNKLNEGQSIFEKTSRKLACLSNKKLKKELSEGKVMQNRVKKRIRGGS